MKLPVGPIDWTPEEHAEYARTGKLPERTAEVASDPIRDRYRLEGELEGRREGREEGLKEAPSKLGKKGGDTPKKEKPWVPYARMLALKIPERARTLPNRRIATILSDKWLKKKPAEWAGEKPDRPSLDTLRKFVSELRNDGTFPPQPARKRRAHVD